MEEDKTEKKVFPAFHVEVDKQHHDMSGVYKCYFKTFRSNEDEKGFSRTYETTTVSQEVGKQLALKFGVEAKEQFDSEKTVLAEILIGKSTYDLADQIENKIMEGYKVQGSPYYNPKDEVCILVIKHKDK